MRVILVSSGLASSYGGAAQSETELACALSRQADVTVLVPADRFDRTYAEKRGVSELVKCFSSRGLLWKKSGSELYDRIAASDIVHFNGHWRLENYFLTRICKSSGTPYVYQPRGMCWVGHRKKTLKRAFNLVVGHSMVRGASRVVGLSGFEQRHLAPYGLASDQWVVVPNGISLPEPLPVSTFNGKYFLYLGRVERRKKLVELVRAYAKYLTDGGSIPLRLVGPVEHGYDQAIERAIRKNQLAKWVTLEKPVYGDEKWPMLADAVALVYPSEEEAFGRAPFEAVAVGCLPVVPLESGSAEYLSPFFPSLIFPLGNLNALATALQSAECFAGDRVPATKFVREELNWDRVGERILSLYRAVLSERPGG